MKNRRIDPNGERWREIPGFNGRYQASDEGRVRQINQDGSALVLKPFIHIPGKPQSKITKPYVVRLIRPDGRKCERSVLGVVASAWFTVPPGMVAYHKNGIATENALWNIGFCTKKELGKLFGRAGKERPCVKVRGGRVLEYYRSAKAAADANFICYASVLKRCNGVVKRPYLPDGTTFRWDEPPRKSTGKA